MTVLRKLRALLSDRSGASAVEFALIAAPLMLLLVGTVEVGRFFWTQHVVQEAAIAGARCMGIRVPDCADADVPSPSKTRAHLRAEARALAVTLAPGEITAEENASCPDPGFSRVEIEHGFVSALPFLTDATIRGVACFPNQ